MTSDKFLRRLRRIYASIDVLKEFDMEKLPAKFIQNDRCVVFSQDFTGGLSEEDMENFAYTVIHNIANLQDHLRKWAARNGKDKKKVDATFNASNSLQLIKDLSNNDKHGYPPRNSGHSNLAPKLIELRRVMNLTTKEEAGSGVVMTFGPDGVPKISGSGTACAVITGDVVDKNNNSIGDLFRVEQDAVKVWENLLTDFGVFVPDNDGT